MLNIKFADGKQVSVEAGTTVYDAAAAAEAILVIGAEFRFRLALPAHILRRDLV